MFMKVSGHWVADLGLTSGSRVITLALAVRPGRQ